MIKIIKVSKIAAIAFGLLYGVSNVNAQIKYDSSGYLTIGNTTPEQFYNINEMGYGLCNAFDAVSQAKSSLVEFNDRIISSDYSVSGWTIHSKNITVTNGAKLKMNIGSSISINKPYIINKGAELEIVPSQN